MKKAPTTAPNQHGAGGGCPVSEVSFINFPLRLVISHQPSQLLPVAIQLQVQPSPVACWSSSVTDQMPAFTLVPLKWYFSPLDQAPSIFFRSVHKLPSPSGSRPWTALWCVCGNADALPSLYQLVVSMSLP